MNTACVYSVEDAHHYFFKCSKYTTFRDVLCQTIQNIIDYDHNFDLDLLLYGSPDHGFTTNTQIFEAVHTHIYILQLQNALYKHCHACQYFHTGTTLYFPLPFSCFFPMKFI